MSEAIRNQMLGTARSALYMRMGEIERELRDVFLQCENLQEKDIPQYTKDKRDRLMKELGENYLASSNLWTFKPSRQ